MKRFCDLKVGDELCVYYSKKIYTEKYFKTRINKINIVKNSLYIVTNWSEFLVNNIEQEFCITELDLFGNEIEESISTSMDRLLLEIGDEE